jgi:hypothetical protein
MRDLILGNKTSKVNDLKEECSFLKKRTKRLLALRWHRDTGFGRRGGGGGESKSLWFFSSEENGFLSYLSESARFFVADGPHGIKNTWAHEN